MPDKEFKKSIHEEPDQCSGQFALFSAEATVYEKEWQGMPEFKMGDQEPFRSIKIHFRCDDDVDKFVAILGDQIHKITPRTKFLWFPKNELIIVRDKRWVSDL